MTTLWRECREAWLAGGKRDAIPPAAFDEARHRAHALRDEAVADAFLALRRIAGTRRGKAAARLEINLPADPNAATGPARLSA